VQYLNKPRWTRERDPGVGRAILTILGVQAVFLVAILTITWIASGQIATPTAAVAAQADPAR
jgi:hypothetical protein